QVTATSAATEPIAAAPAPVNTSSPRVTALGPSEVGATLTTEGGTWQNVTEADLSYVWRRCDRAGGSCSVLPTPQSRAYTLTEADVGSRIKVEVIAGNEEGTGRASSAMTALIANSSGSLARKLIYTHAYP